MLLCSRNRIVLTQEQIAVELGLAGFPEDGPSRRKILQQASNYTQWCKTFGGRWLCFNSGIGSENFLWIKKMVNSSCRKSWQMIAENLSEVNVWKQAAKECRARRALALSRGVHMDTVSLEDVKGTEWGCRVLVRNHCIHGCVNAAEDEGYGKGKVRGWWRKWC